MEVEGQLMADGEVVQTTVGGFRVDSAVTGKVIVSIGAGKYLSLIHI